MGIFSDTKTKRIKETEKKLKKYHGTILLYCSNPDCNAKVKVTHKDANRFFQCSKCSQGFLKRKLDK